MTFSSSTASSSNSTSLSSNSSMQHVKQQPSIHRSRHRSSLRLPTQQSIQIPIPPSLLTSPYLNSPRSIFNQPDLAATASPRIPTEEDEAWLQDTVPLGSPKTRRMADLDPEFEGGAIAMPIDPPTRRPSLRDSNSCANPSPRGRRLNTKRGQQQVPGQQGSQRQTPLADEAALASPSFVHWRSMASPVRGSGAGTFKVHDGGYFPTS